MVGLLADRFSYFGGMSSRVEDDLAVERGRLLFNDSQFPTYSHLPEHCVWEGGRGGEGKLIREVK